MPEPILRLQKSLQLGESLRLEEFLPYRLNVLGAVVSEGLARVYARRFGIDIAGWRVIATLGQCGTATAKSIGQHSHMHKTKVSRAVIGLEKRGLVDRASNADDLREAFVSLTHIGRAMYEDIVPLACAYETQLLDALPEGDRKQLDRLLDALLTRAQEQLKSAF